MRLTKTEIDALADMQIYDLYRWKGATMRKLQTKGLVEPGFKISMSGVNMHGWRLTDAGRSALVEAREKRGK